MRTLSMFVLAGLLLGGALPVFAARDRSIVRPPSSAQTVTAQAEGVTVKSPSDGDTIAQDGSAVQIVFTMSAPDPALDGKLLMVAELLKDGVSMGPAHSLSVPLFAKPNVLTQAIEVVGGRHVSGAGFATAAEGTGYQYRVSLYTGDWNSPSAVIDSGVSGTFSIGKAVTPTSRPTVTVSKPLPASTLALDDGYNVVFQVKHADPTLHGRVKYAVELVCNGANMGLAQQPGKTMLARTDGGNNRLDVTVGAYFDPANSLPRKAVPGVSCQYRATIFTGEWGRSPKVVASGLSGTFILKRPKAKR